MPITADVQTLSPGKLVELYEVDASLLGAEIYRFHAHRQAGPIVFQGKSYTPWAVETAGFALTGEGKQPIPTISLGNVDGFISTLCLYFGDLEGATFTRRRTLAKYLDGMPTADPDQEFPPDVWYIDRKSMGDDTVVQFELASPLNFQNQQLPRGQIIANSCRWLTIGGYRGPYCGYNGPPVADEFDIITTDASKDKCGGRPRSCKLRFGELSQLNYGSYAAAGLIR